MPQTGDASQPQPSGEDSFLDLLVETLDGLDESVRGQFLRQFFRTIAQVDFSDAQSNEYWERILLLRRELAENLGKRVSLKTALVDVLASTNFLRVPILMEYDDFKKLQINAATDALTGLYNRRLFDEYCDKELNRAKRYGQPLAVVILDLHKLKEVNDRYGHLQGDQVLQLAAATLRKTMRASDFAFRIGGDEFALLLPQTDPEQAITLCRRIRSQYESDIRPLKMDVGVTLDFGVAVHPHDGEQKSALMNVADQRLYELKNAGREDARVIPPETQAPREIPAAPRAQREASVPPQPVQPSSIPGVARTGAAAPAQTPPASPTPPAATQAAAAAPRHGEARKWERVSLAGTKAYAVLTDVNQKSAAVLDLSYGGVALLLENAEDLPTQFHAVLHVPILPPVRVVLRRAHSQRMDGGRVRVGCSFVS
ncbi:MAG: GGDEF domain-containing protein [Candidatus Acidiferrales bacterium]